MKLFYVYEILNADGNVIYVGKGYKNRMKRSMLERNGKSCREVRRFNHESDAYAFEVKQIAKYSGLLNANKGGAGGLLGASTAKILNPEQTRSLAAKNLLGFYLAFKALASKVDIYYSKELQSQFNAMNPRKLYEVAYG